MTVQGNSYQLALNAIPGALRARMRGFIDGVVNPLGGVLGASAVAWFADAIAAAASGMGQELFNAAVLFLAVIMLGWHNVWMSQHGRELAIDLKNMGAAIRGGARPMHVLAAVVAMAPTLIAFLFLRRRIVDGITLTGLKG